MANGDLRDRTLKMANDPKFGVSGVMSSEPPTQKDLKLDEALLQELKLRNEFESGDETRRRYVARVRGVKRQIETNIW